MRIATLAFPLAAACLAAPAAAQERFTLTGDQIAVYNLAGWVEVVAGTGPSVTVELVRRGADGARLRVEQGPIAGRSTLRVISPGEALRYGEGAAGSSELRVRDDGTFGDGGGRERPGRRVRVGPRVDGPEAWADLRVSVPEGRDLAIYLGVGRIEATGVGRGRLRLDASAAEVVANRVQGEVDIDTGSGNVAVAEAQGSLRVDTGSGDVRITGMRGSRLTLDTGSGQVTVEGATADEVLVDTGSGDVTLSGITADRLHVDTGSGDVTASLDGQAREITVDTGSGRVQLRLPAGVGATVSLDTSSGDIETAFPLTVTRRGRHRLSGTIGTDAEAGRITVSTGSGDIALLRP